MSSLPIGEYALLSDRHSAALVSSGGSVDWLCMPRFDSPSIFAAILDDEAGHWSIRPDADFRVEREYVAGSMVLLTKFHTSAGTLELRDTLALGDTHNPHSLGEHAPHLLARTATCTRGSIDVIMSFRARPEYGLVAPVTTAVDGGLVAIGGANLLTLSSTVPLEVKRDEANARFELGSGERTCFALQYSALGAATPELRTGPEISALVDQTVTGSGVVGAPPELPRPLVRPRAPFRTSAAGAQLPAHRRDRRRTHHLPARASRRRTELGLPLLLGPRREHDHAGTVGRRVSR